MTTLACTHIASTAGLQLIHCLQPLAGVAAGDRRTGAGALAAHIAAQAVAKAGADGGVVFVEAQGENGLGAVIDDCEIVETAIQRTVASDAAAQAPGARHEPQPGIVVESAVEDAVLVDSECLVIERDSDGVPGIETGRRRSAPG